MTRHAMVTIIAPIPIDNVDTVRATIAETLGNPASEQFRDCAAPPDADPFLHFASLHALAGSAGDAGYLIFEFSADGEDAFAITELAARTETLLRPIFAMAKGFHERTDLASFWRRHQISIGFGMGDAPGLAFSGTPGLSVVDIQREKALAHHLRAILPEGLGGSPGDVLKNVRRQLHEDSQFSWALTPPEPMPEAPKDKPGTAATIAALAAFGPVSQWGFGEWIRTIGQVLGFTLGTLGLVVLFSGAILGALYARLRSLEESDFVSDRRITDDELAPMLARENAQGFSQNHMMSHTVRKPGWLRRTTTRLAFFIVASLTRLRGRPGFLGDLGTIHFARWITIPGTRDFVFLSNYGGSWESYLEDFITKANDGLSAIWSNAIGFPKTQNLIQGGASQAEPFKRYARESMVYTPFWYCAYPDLSTANIRANHQLRRGLASAPRPPGKLEASQMQSLLFGGMGFKPEGKLMLIELPDDPSKARALLNELMPFIAFGDGRYYLEPALITFALSAQGLAKLGLPDDALATFPIAFREGMTGAGRNRILGDLGSNAMPLIRRPTWSPRLTCWMRSLRKVASDWVPASPNA